MHNNNPINLHYSALKHTLQSRLADLGLVVTSLVLADEEQGLALQVGLALPTEEKPETDLVVPRTL